MRIAKGWGRLALCVLASLALAGCATHYVDGNTKEIPAAQFKKPATLHAVQFFFEFQTKSVANSRVTEMMKSRVIEQINSSGLFSAVSDSPAAEGALLSITLNNVPLSDDAFSKGFVTGLTFGLAGSKVSDGYVCTARYRGSMTTEPIVKQARHAIHTTLGVTSEPGNAVKAASTSEAVTLMTRQVVSTVLNDISADPAFQ